MSESIALLIVGGGPTGLSAARAYRDAGGANGVAIVSDEHRMPYRRPPLTKELLQGEIEESELPLEREQWLDEHAVELIGGRAVALDLAARTVTLSGGRELGFQQCLLATGAEPKRLPVPGVDRPGVVVVRSLDHHRELQHRLADPASGSRPPDSRPPDSRPPGSRPPGSRPPGSRPSDSQSPGNHMPVAVVGSGFIGCEIASSLRRNGHPVTLVSDESAPNAARLGNEAAAIIRDWLEADGVELLLGAPLERIERAGERLRLTAGAHHAEAGTVVMAAGVSPRSELARQAGVELAGGAIPVSAAMRTRNPALLAAGDVCRAENVTAGRPLRVEHWGEALIQGEIAGRAAAGEKVAWDGVPGFWSTIGRRTLKYTAWGDGFDSTRLESHPGGGFTIWYGHDDVVVGVLTHRADGDYAQGREAIAKGARWS